MFGHNILSNCTVKLYREAYLARFLHLDRDVGVFSGLLLGDGVARHPDASLPDLAIIIFHPIYFIVEIGGRLLCEFG